MLQFFYNFFLNLAALFRSPIFYRRKISVLFVYLRLTLIAICAPRFYKRGLKKIRFLGFTLEGFSFETNYFLFSEIFVKNEYFFASDIKDPVIYDCGANVGAAVFYFKWLYPGAIINAFEADPSTSDVLKKNIKANNLKGVSVYQVALSGEEGEIDFFIDSEQGGSLKMSTIQRSERVKTVRVLTRTLSEYVSKSGPIDFLKMDIEGAEVSVIADMARDYDIFKKVKKITLEYHHHIGGKKAELASLLSDIERSGFDYVLSARHSPGCKQSLFQDILISCGQ